MGDQRTKPHEANANSCEESYLGQLWKLVGSRKLLTPAARAVIQDNRGRVLFVQRRDTRKWGMPAGAMELDESILDCLKREVTEETGLEVVSATPIAIYSGSRYTFTYPSGKQLQALAVVFRVDEWRGTLVTNTDETIDARFFDLDDLPDTYDCYRETVKDLCEYDGRIIVK
ncbi:NUDIX domain-containing protein [Candidatus Hydrogenedentota bacterium]